MIKLPKKVTLVVVIVSAIFGICWLTDSALYFLDYISSPYSDVTFAIATIMILFNSAVNPFVYALVNRRFSQKIKGMLGFADRLSANNIPPNREQTGRTELAT